MRNIVIVVLGLIIGAFMVLKIVPNGYLGVLSSNEDELLLPGYHAKWPNDELYLFPITMQNQVWNKVEIQTLEGLIISANMGISYRIKPENISKIFKKYHTNANDIKVYLYSMLLEAIDSVSGTMSTEEIYNSKKDEFISAITQMIKIEAYRMGVDIEKVYVVGSFSLPDSVRNLINSKIKLVEAENQAKANQILSKSLTNEILQYNFIQRWNGQLPEVSGTQSSSLLTIKGISNG